ncbi:stage III sporulation protein AA [Haloimpatiens lingqiaonensis]|uniref:stage III sporulation protein AA n=1 Tax=Haloimpatiens lingqiaonensis TaxID=1380675 RepID=UPI0010FF60C5|nr:stage III sporulation protein AA [Haloimpatiens lingqiaonensis]
MYLYGLEKFLNEALIKLIQNTEELDKLQEIRIRLGKPIILGINNKEILKNYIPKEEELKSIIQRFSSYSLYAFDEEIRQGYITIRGGHRIGICGSCVVEKDKIKTIKNISSINIRICRQIIGCANKVMPFLIENGEPMNTIIISPPKCGKTTLIRDITRNISNGMDGRINGKKVSVIDERSEIAGCYLGVPQMDVGIRTDVLDSCPKSYGISMAIRSMGPEVIVCDEIGTYRDMENIILALNSGVKVITTIHGYDENDLYRRAVFKEIIDNKVFSRAIILSNTKGVGTVEYVYDFNKGSKV